MMHKFEVLKALNENKFVLVLRADSKEEAIKIAENSIESGIDIIEITFTIPKAEEVINFISEKYKENKRIIIGAGTVLDSETARIAIMNGAKFIVAPTFSINTCKLCNRYGVVYIPGCFTPTEIITAREEGCDVVKLFPGSAFSPRIVKDIKAPIEGIKIMVSGGVDYENIEEWLNNDADIVSIGSAITKIKDKEKMKKEVLKYMGKVNKYRGDKNEESFGFRGVINEAYAKK